MADARIGAVVKARFIRELTEGSRVETTFIVRAKESRIARTGDRYLALELSDRTGSMPAVHFRPDQEAMSVPAGSVACVTAVVSRYKGSARMLVEELRPASTWSSGDFVATGHRPAEELEREFTALVRSIEDAGMRGILRRIFGDPVFRESFFSSPATRSGHHSYIGGLAQHTLAVADSCHSLCENHDFLDRGLLLTAALLHDVGCVDELECGTGIGLTDEGRLLGHVQLGTERLALAARETSMLMADRALRLRHVVAAHHHAVGSQTQPAPAIVEAFALNHADSLDIVVAEAASVVSGVAAADERWSGEANPFRRPIGVTAVHPDQAGDAVTEEAATLLSA